MIQVQILSLPGDLRSLISKASPGHAFLQCVVGSGIVSSSNLQLQLSTLFPGHTSLQGTLEQNSVHTQYLSSSVSLGLSHTQSSFSGSIQLFSASRIQSQDPDSALSGFPLGISLTMSLCYQFHLTLSVSLLSLAPSGSLSLDSPPWEPFDFL